MSNRFEAVVFSRPGEAGLIPYLGTLWAAENNDFCINKTKAWIAPSTTSFVALMKLLGFSCFEIMMFLVMYPQLAEVQTPFKNPLNLGESMNDIRMAISLKIIEKLGNIPTLEELYIRTGVIFIGVGFCLARQEVEYIHRETYPSMSILDVICISLSTPGIYHPHRVEKELWIDGSITEQFSLSSIELNSGKILVITTKRKKVLFTNRDPIGQNVNLMRAIFESMRQVTVTSNMILVEIDSNSKEESLKLREGWIAFTKMYKLPDKESDFAAELQT
jgi:hypothetical protein